MRDCERTLVATHCRDDTIAVFVISTNGTSKRNAIFINDSNLKT